MLASGQVDAIGAWQPVRGQAMKALPGSRPVYTSAQAPGLIYDVLAVNPTKLAANKAEWIKLINVWDRVVALHQRSQDATRRAQDHVGARRVDARGIQTVAEGTHLIDVAEGKKVFQKGPGLESLYGSSQTPTT